jgi:hypothetical protein
MRGFMTLFRCFLFLAALLTLPLYADETKRDYFSPMTGQEAQDIRYIITTLGETSTVGLLMKKSTLEQAGNRIGHVHPLKFFGFILSDQRLRRSFGQMKGIAWKNFVNGMAGSFAVADTRRNLSMAMIEDFARAGRLDPAIVNGYIQNRRWKELIHFVRKQA